MGVLSSSKLSKIYRMILTPKSKLGRPPLALRLTMFFDCRSRPRSCLLELILNLSSSRTFVAFNSYAYMV
ncbi:hypothetical protein Hanom_Chr03g00187501 [Helianthus anomalus]